MRDIRGDLQERAKFIDAQISSAYAHFEKLLEQLQSERDGRVAELKSELEAVTRLMEIEHRRMGGPAAIQPPRSSLADFLVHKLSEFGAMSSVELRDLAAQEGVLPESENVGRAVQAALAGSVREERIRQLPDGRFAPLTVSQAIGLRNVV
jgi:hypothetical protein